MTRGIRVVAVSTPTSDSAINFEVWIPAAEAWNGKFQGVGNGGFAGVINYTGLSDAVKHGYAGASTDTGHHAGGTDDEDVDRRVARRPGAAGHRDLGTSGPRDPRSI